MTEVEQRANDMLAAIQMQRDNFANQVVNLIAEIESLKRKITELEKEEPKEE